MKSLYYFNYKRGLYTVKRQEKRNIRKERVKDSRKRGMIEPVRGQRQGMIRNTDGKIIFFLFISPLTSA